MARTLDDLDWPVRTARLTIRRAGPGDALATYAYRSRPEVAHWLTHHPQDPQAWAAGFGGRVAQTLIVEVDGALAGDLYVHVQDHWAQAEVADSAAATLVELGWVLDPAYAGHGYATEAALEALRICFAELGVRRVVAECFADNERSWRLMERLGMRREQHGVRDSLHRSGQWLDGLTYALLAEEWSAADGVRSRP